MLVSDSATCVCVTGRRDVKHADGARVGDAQRVLRADRTGRGTPGRGTRRGRATDTAGPRAV
eukprot:1519141-Prymnesium_polylepis.1